VQSFDERHQNNFVRIPAFATADHKEAASVCAGRRRSKCYCCCLESEVHAGADHAKVVMGPVHKVPAEVTDPADMRGETDFQAAADLGYCLRLGIGVLGANKTLFEHDVVSLAAAKDAATATEDVRCEPGARNRITQCEGA